MSTAAAAGAAPAATRRRAVFHRLRVAAVEPLTDDAVAVTFEVPDSLGDAFRFEAGQHVSIRSPVPGDEVRRSYSICSPAGSGILRVGVKHLPGGVFSGHVHEQLRQGDALEVMTPTGGFRVPPDAGRARHLAVIAAGSGITPILSIVATTLEREPRGEVTLVYANRTSSSIMFVEELEDLKDRHPARFRIFHVLSREARDAPLLSGRLDAARLGAFLDGPLPPATVDEWFVCGPLGLVTTVREVLRARGVDASHVHAELFRAEAVGAAAAPATAGGRGPDGAATVEVGAVLDGRRSTLTMERSATILEAVLRVRADAPFACRGGVCGTCRARLLEGTVTMDQCWALEPDEVAAGTVLTCQSRPASARVVVDYDG